MKLLTNFEVTYYTRRCTSCGKFWACESEYSEQCPHCAWRTIEERNETIAVQGRQIRALRAARTRAKNKAKASER